MPAEIGSTLVWTVYTRDAAGALADATSPALSVVLPDGTVKTSAAHPTVVAITKTATGTYRATCVSSLAGRYRATASGTGVANLPFTDVADVVPADPRLIIPLTDARAALMSPADPWDRLLVARLARDFQQMRFDFLRTLAADRQQLAVGVILSGMGSDGTLGLRAIRESAGATFAQSPESAKFDGMPRSAIDAGVVDIVATPAALFESIMAFVQHRHELLVDDRAEVETPPTSGLDAILQLLRRRSGHDFGQYKPTTLARRISRRMGLLQDRKSVV